jgi:hypothetical protein
MKVFVLIYILCLLSVINCKAQTSEVLEIKMINNTGNQNQAYPVINETDPYIQDLLNEISINNLENNIRIMQNMGIRAAESETALHAQNWLVDELECIGLDVFIYPALSPYNLSDTLNAGNVVAFQYGTVFPEEYIVISSHYDHDSGPGADDNASGTSGMLECARILSQHSFKRSIVYISFNAEEYGLYGSIPFVERCAEDNISIPACFNLDMLGFFPEQFDNLEMYAGTTKESENLFKYFQNVANVYVPEIPMGKFTHLNSYSADNLSFNAYEYPALYVGDIEYKHLNECYHRPCDTLGDGVNSMELVHAFTSVTLAATAELANGWLPPQRFSAISGNSSIKLNWNTADEADSYKIYKNNEFLTEVSDTVFVDNYVEAGTEYKYFVTAIHEITGEESGRSNSDSVFFSAPLSLPYYNDFEQGYEEWHFCDSDWGFNEMYYVSGTRSFCNNTGTDFNYSPAELQWFSIPDTSTNVSLKFQLKNHFSPIIEYHLVTKLHFLAFLEITTDRKHWEKILYINDETSIWNYQSISLNDYIGEEFIQIRFYIKSTSGSANLILREKIYIDNISIDFTASGNDVHVPYEIKNNFKPEIFPNPSKGNFSIYTGLSVSYKVDIFNLQGVKVFEQEYFKDGEIDTKCLQKGVFFVRISSGNNSVSKKIIIE